MKRPVIALLLALRAFGQGPVPAATVGGAGGGGGTGTVTSVSVATANGFAGTVANPTTTPAITVSTTVTGVLKGNGTAESAAAAADIVGLFSTCSGTQYLGADGACHNGGGSGSGGLFCAATMSSNALTCTPSPALGSYSAGVIVNFTSSANNSGATTINISGLGARNLYYGGSALPSGSLPSTTITYQASFDGTEFNCLNCGNGYTYEEYRVVAQNTVAGGNFSLAPANFANWVGGTTSAPPQGVAVQDTNSGNAAQTGSAEYFGGAPLFPNSTLATAAVGDLRKILPPSWISGSGLSIVVWMYTPRSTSYTGNVVLNFRAQCVASGSTIGSYSAVKSTTITPGAAGVHLATVISLTTSDVLSGCGANQMLWLQVFRDHSNASDTYNDTAVTPLLMTSLFIGTPGGAGGTQGATGATGATGAAGASGTVNITAGTSVSLTTAVGQIFICTSTCTVTPPVPANGAQYCVYNDDNVSTVITFAGISGVQYETTARTGYGTAGNTFVSGGAVGDRVCIVYRDSAHYSTVSYNGTWTAN
jgi:hypothetical protein